MGPANVSSSKNQRLLESSARGTRSKRSPYCTPGFDHRCVEPRWRAKGEEYACDTSGVAVEETANELADHSRSLEGVGEVQLYDNVI